jgi:citrate lyase subunit beta-like protein
MELLYPRSKLVTAAKANGLQAIDLVRSVFLKRICPSKLTLTNQVCVDYQNERKLRAEVEEGRRLGFDGKVSSEDIRCSRLISCSKLYIPHR